MKRKLGRDVLERDAARLRTIVHTTASGSPGGVNEGPGLDLVAETLGLGGDTILVLNSGGSPVAEHAATSDGLDAATAAAASGDVIWLPAVTISGNHTLASGVHYIGVSRWATILTGAITAGVGTTLEVCSITRTADSGDDLKGFIGAGGGLAKLGNVDVTCTQAGAGNAYAVACENGGSVEAWLCNLQGSSVGGDGYAGYTTAGNLYQHNGRGVGSTDEYNT